MEFSPEVSDARYSWAVIRPAFVIGTLTLITTFACVGDEPEQGFTAAPTRDEFLASCGKGKCSRSTENCTSAFACQIDLFSSYKVRDVMQCLKEAEATEGCISCTDRVAEVKYSKDAGDMVIACKLALADGKGKCKGFTCPSGLRLYRDDLLANLTKCYEKSCDTDPYAVVKCLNITAFAKAPKCQTSCCTGGLFYACPSADAATACFGGDTSACQPEASLDGVCAP